MPLLNVDFEAMSIVLIGKFAKLLVLDEGLFTCFGLFETKEGPELLLAELCCGILLECLF